MSFVVTIDGPAAAGKSTTARALARALGFLHVDTGALYRALALKAWREGVRPDDDVALERCVSNTRLSLGGTADHPEVWLDDAEVSAEIRTPAVSELSSRLAARPVVRRQLVAIQRALRERGPLVGEGRDLGTVVFPDAEVKIYLDADLETRARRRHEELTRRGIGSTLEQVRSQLERRDERDKTRADSPLRVAEGAVVVDTSGLDVAEQIERVLAVVRAHPAFPAASAAKGGAVGGDEGDEHPNARRGPHH